MSNSNDGDENTNRLNTNEQQETNNQEFSNTLDGEQLNNFIFYNTFLNTLANNANQIPISMENFNQINIPLLNAQINPNAFLQFQLQQQQQQQQQQYRQSHPHSHSHAHSHSHMPAYNNLQDQNINYNSQQQLYDPNYNQDVVVNLSSINNDESMNDTNGDENNNADNEHNQSQEQQQQQQPNNILRLILLSLQTNIPILLILFAKIFHQHLLGFLIVIAFLATLHWSNRSLVNQVELKERKSNIKLLILIGFLLSNIALFFFAFSSYQLHYCLIFFQTNIKTMDVWNLIWIVVCCDIIAKLMTICLKALVTLLPCRVVPIRRRGNYYSAIESIGLFYRCLIPIHPWILFLFNNKNNTNLTDSKYDATTETESSTLFPLILCIIYLIFKLNHIYNRYLELSNIILEVLKDQSYGIPASKLDYDDSSVCPICQDKYTNPVQLKCKHVFCQDCVTVWLDREQTCPMCRAKVSSKKPNFKDGSTSIYIQWY